jgi:geranylgeranyl pyrophosphate synthase
MHRALDILEDTGARHYAQKAAEGYRDGALRELKELWLQEEAEES